MYKGPILFGRAFGQIVAAQFWIAAFNTLLTAIFLLVLMPLWGPHLPYTPALITLTFAMVPPEGTPLSAADIKARTATVLAGRFATICGVAQALERAA